MSILVPTVAAPRLLIVDDDIDVCDTLVELLRAEGHEVSATTNAAAALSRLRAACADHVVVCDVVMPDVDGLDFAFEVAADETLRRRTSLILLSASPVIEGIRRLPSVAGVLRKPFDMIELLALVRDVAEDMQAP